MGKHIIAKLIFICCAFGIYAEAYGQNLVVNGSMNSIKGENRVALPWIRVRTGLPANTPDINDANDNAQTTTGWNWYLGQPEASPDGGTWQNIFGLEDFAQTITGLSVGATYYFAYYYSTQCIRDFQNPSFNVTPAAPNITLAGATGYQNPTNTGELFEWSIYYGTIVAQSTSLTVTAFSHPDVYMAYDGFYLSLTPLSFPQLVDHPADLAVCLSANTNFSVTALNATAYQWQENEGVGWQDLSDNGIYTGTRTNNLQMISPPATLDQRKYRCKITNDCCAVYSSDATLSIISPSTPSLVINSSKTEICEGMSVTFTAFPTFAGSSPLYRWKKNGILVGNNLQTYSDNQLLNGDMIECELTASSPCQSVLVVNSNIIKMIVTPNAIPAISIAAASNNLCAGTRVTFTASYENGGTSPLFSWTKNGTSVGTNSIGYIDGNLKNGDIVACMLQSDLTCVSLQTVTSLPLTMSVLPLLTPSVAITTSATEICAGETLIFEAIPENPGTSPFYSWKKNGVAMGTNSPTYQDGALRTGDLITCTVTSSETCLSGSQATATAGNFKVNPNPVVSLEQNEILCIGTARTLDPGQFASYSWNTGANTRTIQVDQLGTYRVEVTNSSGCSATAETNVTKWSSPPSSFLGIDTAICSYGELTLKPEFSFGKYVWSTGAMNNTIIVRQPGEYKLTVTDKFGCVGIDTIIVKLKDCLQGFYMPTAFTPNNDGVNDVLKPFLFGNTIFYRFQIYNRWGELLFTATDPYDGWRGNTGSRKHESGVFIWVCSYRVAGEQTQERKGTVTLIR